MLVGVRVRWWDNSLGECSGMVIAIFTDRNIPFAAVIVEQAARDNGGYVGAIAYRNLVELRVYQYPGHNHVTSPASHSRCLICGVLV